MIKQALKEQRQQESMSWSGPIWDPIRPLLGFGDWMERVTWVGTNGSKPPGTRAAQAMAWFRRGNNDSLILRKTYRDEAARRLEIVESLLKVVPATPRSVRHDPALRAMLVHERGKLKRVIETTLWPSEQRTALKGLKCPLYHYQRDGVRRFLETGRLLLADDMGLGKTAQAITCCDILWRTGRVKRGLIIAPASLKPQWAREWAHFSDLPVEIVDGPPERAPGCLYLSQRRILDHQL